MTHSSLRNVLFSFQLFAYFLLLFLLLSSSFNALWSDRMHGIISVFLYLLRLALCPKIWLILEKFHGLLRRMCIMQKFDEILYRHQLGRFDLWCGLGSRISLLMFCLDDLSVSDRGVLNSPTTTVFSLYMLLGPSEYFWWNWVCWHWLHIGW
jgi:hypothetical protein